MYVIKDDSDGTIYPADRCTWKEAYVEGAMRDDGSRVAGFYRVSDATYFNGNSSTGTTIDTPIYGVIGKNGRFVPMTS